MRTKLKLAAQIGGFYAIIALALFGAAWVASDRMPVVHAQVGSPAIQKNILVTVATAGTPVRVTTLHIMVSSYMIQPVVGTTVGLGYLCIGIQNGTVPAAACAATANGSYELGGQLAAATSTVPGPVYNFYVPPPGVDLGTIWIDVAVSGTSELVSYFPK